MRTAAIITATLLLTACSPERRLQRLLDKFPELSRVDTITVTDTIVVPGDTLWRSVLLRTTDTVTVENKRQVVKIQRIRTGSPCDTAAIALDVEARVKPDTVYSTITVEVPRVVPCPEDAKVHKWWRTAAYILAVFSLALFLLYRYPPNRSRE
jgi:hypothetical protein